MHTIFKIRYHLNRALLTVLGPAELDDQRSPIAALDREWQERFGAPRRPAASPRVPQPRSASGRGLALRRVGAPQNR